MFFVVSAAPSCPNCTTCRSHLYLRYGYGYVKLLLFYPSINHCTRNSSAGSIAHCAHISGCIAGAELVVETAYILETRGMLCEAHPLALPPLAFAATALAHVELRASSHELVSQIRPMSQHAKTVLEAMALHSIAAAQCLDSLKVCMIHLCMRCQTA